MATNQMEVSLDTKRHVDYVVSLNTKTQDYEYWLTEHLRMSGIYWGYTALHMLKAENKFDKDELISFVMSCQDEKTGGFGAYPNHDPHLLYTLSALQILEMTGQLNTVITYNNKQKIVNFIKSLQLSDGSFQGDKYGEVDTRFVYNAISSLSLLTELTDDIVDPAVNFILQCQNFDGGFGLVPGSESHAAQVFTCLGTLAICDKLDKLPREKQELLAWWLCERQQDMFMNSKEFEGGLNGRPEKLPDVCYSWWVLSSLSILGKVDWIDKEKLIQFILKAQDLDKGGISDRPDNEVDVFHTNFGLAGLSLLGYPGLIEIDPVYCMPKAITAKFKKWKI